MSTRGEDRVAKNAVVGRYASMARIKMRAGSVADQDTAFMVGINQFVFLAEAPKYAYITDKEINAETVTVRFSVNMESGDQNA